MTNQDYTYPNGFVDDTIFMRLISDDQINFHTKSGIYPYYHGNSNKPNRNFDIFNLNLNIKEQINSGRLIKYKPNLKLIGAAIHQKLMTPPEFVLNNLNRLVVTGSHSYGTASEDSDYDIAGYCTPPESYLYPKVIHGYDDIPTFEQYAQHHIEIYGYKLDITIYNIAKFFKLAEKNNPNIIDILYSNEVLFSDEVGDLVYQNKDHFLSKDLYPRFIGFVKNHYYDIVKLRTEAGRKERVEKHGYDTKAAYHLIRVYLELIQILEEHTLDLKRNSKLLNSIKNGSLKLEDFIIEYQRLSSKIEEIKTKSTLREHPEHDKIRDILVKCLSKQNT